jgi:hypothetical protein
MLGNSHNGPAHSDRIAVGSSVLCPVRKAIYNEDQLPSETAVRRVGGWCEMAPARVESEFERESAGRQSDESCRSWQFGYPQERECLPWKALLSRAVKTVTENTSLCLIVVCEV